VRPFPPLDTFAPRHIGPRDADREAMLATVKAPTLDALIDEVIPEAIRLARPLQLPDAESESTYLARLESIAALNKVYRSFIGLGYHDTLTPSTRPTRRIRRKSRRGASSRCSISRQWSRI
jgi:glycine dehydrogenase